MRVHHDADLPQLPAGNEHFTGDVRRTDYVRPDDPDGLSGSRFRYEPGARSHWHVHEHEQVIVAVEGTGLISWDGLAGPVQLHTGDWWHVEPGVAHWHGATATEGFAHLAVTAGGDTRWLHEVAEDDYRAEPVEP